MKETDFKVNSMFVKETDVLVNNSKFAEETEVLVNSKNFAREGGRVSSKQKLEELRAREFAE